MQKDRVVLQTSQILQRKNILHIILAVLLITSLLLAIFDMKVLERNSNGKMVITNFLLAIFDKEVVMPNNSNGKMPFSYMATLTGEAITLVLDVTPANVEYNTKEILKITHPSFYGALKTKLQARAKDVQNRKISTFFSPSNYSHYVQGDDGKSIYVVGKLSTFLGKKEVSSEEKAYVVAYKLEGLKPLLIDFHEVDPKAKDER
jgi:hypothetical protein